MSSQMNRREFLEKGRVAAAALSAASVGMMTAACAPSPDDTRAGVANAPRGNSLGEAALWRGAVVQPDEGDLLISGGRRAPVRFKVESTVAIGATMSMIVSQVDPGATIPVHLHRNEDELIFIHTGSGIVTLGDDRIPVSAGAVLYGPRNIWHGIENTGSTIITWCAVYSPPGFEQFFREVGVPPGQEGSAPTRDQVLAIARKYGMIFREA
jgi:mannose-6-phosphate isomerase-like protein (cupin superfamily)